MGRVAKRKSQQMEKEESDTDEEHVSSTVAKKGKSSALDAIMPSKLMFNLAWTQYGNVSKSGVKPLYYLWSKTVTGSKKIAAFDIDNTLIKTKSGKNFATNAADWEWLNEHVVKNLKQLNSDGYRVVFITNQAGIEKKRVSFDQLKSKFETMLKQLEIPVFIFVATGESHFRKPSTEIWNFLSTECNQGIKPDLEHSFYVGDAAGRPKNWTAGVQKDFSCADRMFAFNNDLKFYTPEEYFLKEKPAIFDWGSIDPNQLLIQHKSEPVVALPAKFQTGEQELIIMIGLPASGKSTFAKRTLLPLGYCHINRDTMITQDKCLKACESFLKEGKSVVVDNTNPSKKTRADYIKIAQKYKVKVRCFRTMTDPKLCHHLNYVRQNQTQGEVRRIPDVGFNVFKSQFEEPTLAEGFSEIHELHFVPQFDSEADEKVFKQWTF